MRSLRRSRGGAGGRPRVSATTSARPFVAVAAAVAVSIGVGGCGSPTEPPIPPGGGSEYTLDFELFAATVRPVLVSAGCNTIDCHGGGIRGNYQLSSPAANDDRFDFDQTVLQVSPHDPEGSPILTQPLTVAAGGELHPHEPFESPEDPGYVTILAWVQSGETR